MNFRMTRRHRIYEGKGKVLFEGPEPGTYIQYFKDETATANGKKKTEVAGKGVLNNRISAFLMTKLNEIGVPTHFMRRINMREQLVRQVEIIPLEVVVRNIAAGDFATRLGIKEGTQLPRSIVEFFFKRGEHPMVTDEHITAFGWANPYELEEMMQLALRVNDYLSGLFWGVGVRLVDFRVEFGRLWDQDEMRIVLADELSPDNCRLWDIETNERLDKDRFDRDLGHVEEAYQEIARRLGILPENDHSEQGPRFFKPETKDENPAS